ncbi:hypothetical protein HYT84_02635 [Candidatus Micrarchaeota archaeon]|nr:hypothetical protein [Candidatus Micrarchaeota archaeon]
MEIRNAFEVGKYFTYELTREKPIYNWFYYKEGFAPEIVDFMIEKTVSKLGILDPFCGSGTTLLRAKELGISSTGIDSSPLSVFVSKVKTQNYEENDLVEVEEFLNTVQKLKEGKFNWKFELFNPKNAFPFSNFNNILSLRTAIEGVENEKARDLLLLALVSIIPQASLVIKDGGVLKIDKRKRAIPTKEAFKRKIKRMVRNLNGKSNGFVPNLYLGDARRMEIENESVDLIVTSPPYLNNIDYSKIYGLELSLLEMNEGATKQTRNRSLRSFITNQSIEFEIPESVREFADKIPIVGSYFADINQVVKEMHRVLAHGGKVGFVVGNSVIHETHVLVDEIIGELAEEVGFKVEILVGLERIADVMPAKVKTRESIIIMTK